MTGSPLFQQSINPFIHQSFGLSVAKTFNQFLRRGDGRADFANHDARRMIGENGRLDGDAPAAIARVNVAMTVSPAPETSNTSCATVGI